MPWTFSGVELGARALQTMQMAMNVTGHNLANINTPGYSRQRANLETTEPNIITGLTTLYIGSGVRVQSIQRIRDIFLDARVANANSEFHRQNTLYSRLTQIEDVFSEPGEAGLSKQITAFFNAFQELSTNPENIGIRASVYQQVDSMSSYFRQLASRLDDLRDEMHQQLQAIRNEMQFIARSIADINAKVRYNKALGADPNDLLDKRTYLIEKLSEYVSVQTTELPDGSVRVSIGGFALVEGIYANPLPPQIDIANKSFTDGANMHVKVFSGSVRGLMETLDYVHAYRTQLDLLARELINAVNAIHQTGYGLDGQTGYRLLDGIDALSIRVSEDVRDINRIAAGVTASPGDGNKALELARLRQLPIAALDNKTIPGYYGSLVAQLGQHTRSASIGRDNQQIILQNLQAEREAVSGVNMDEELSNLLRYQRSYQAAAQFISVMDAAVADMIAAFVRR